MPLQPDLGLSPRPPQDQERMAILQRLHDIRRELQGSDGIQTVPFSGGTSGGAAQQKAGRPASQALTGLIASTRDMPKVRR